MIHPSIHPSSIELDALMCSLGYGPQVPKGSAVHRWSLELSDDPPWICWVIFLLREDVWFCAPDLRKSREGPPFSLLSTWWFSHEKKTHRNHHISLTARHGAPLPNRHGGCHGATAMPGGQAMPWKPKDAIAQSDRHIFGMWTSWEFWVGTLEQKKCVSWYKLG